ncbi:MAG: hypothetical protein RLZZ84_1521 [Pseudomonadota bacterium]|jgi:HlyD family secretion protein
MVNMVIRWRWALLIAGVLIAGLGFAFWPEPVPVDAGRITRGPMAVSVTDDGVTRAREFYVVSAPVTGYLSRIELEAGDKVARGDLITYMAGRPSAPLDPRSQQELRAAITAARAIEAGASATLAQSRRDLDRSEALARRGFLSRAQLEAARTRIATVKAALEQARGEIARLQSQLAAPTGETGSMRVAVRAPARGWVLAVINESAGVIAEGTPLVTIGNPHEIEAVVDLLSRDAVRTRPGDKVEISQWGGEVPLVGRVDRIEPYGRLKVSALGIEEQRVNVIVAFDTVTAAQAARLGHGYQIDATIVLWSRDNVLRVPISALFRGADGGWRVFAIEDGRAREREIRIGHISDAFGEVLGGLALDQAVVINPGNTLVDGAKVKPR